MNFKNLNLKHMKKIFHKFIISSDLKVKIQKDLYLDGYPHENLFLNYDGIVQSIKNRTRLDNILQLE